MEWRPLAKWWVSRYTRWSSASLENRIISILGKNKKNTQNATTVAGVQRDEKKAGVEITGLRGRSPKWDNNTLSEAEKLPVVDKQTRSPSRAGVYRKNSRILVHWITSTHSARKYHLSANKIEGTHSKLSRNGSYSLLALRFNREIRMAKRVQLSVAKPVVSSATKVTYSQIVFRRDQQAGPSVSIMGNANINEIGSMLIASRQNSVDLAFDRWNT